jgi:DNA-binding transcriptional ArsR family regulator
MDENDETTADSHERGMRELDLVALKALAHPLRVQLFDALTTYGNATASGLAERFSESSGATSYHLRQLERHGFVREVEGKGTGRERWWERVPGSITIGTEDVVATPAGRSASDMIARQMRMSDEQLISDYIARAPEVLSREWREASAMSTINTRMTAEQLGEFASEIQGLAERMVRRNRGKNPPGSRPVHITFNAFPVMDGDVTPGEVTTTVEVPAPEGDDR